jgi:hypothetical protein
MSYYSKLFWGEVADNGCRYEDELVEFAIEFGYPVSAIGWDENTWTEAMDFIIKMELVELAGKLIHSFHLESVEPYGHF